MLSKNKIRLIKSLDSKKAREETHLFIAEGGKSVIDLIKARMPEIGNEEETSVVIQVVQDTDGLYTPDEEEVAHARRVMEAMRMAEQAGTGVFTVDGKMVDAPVIAKARRVLLQIGEEV